jgi:tetratricopeptide (TPR) repeat protein
MLDRNRCAKINVKLLIILILVTVAIGISLVAARQVRRSIVSKMSLKAGTAAFESKDWPAACENFQEYLGRNPDDVEILKKYAKTRLSIQPLDAGNIVQAIAAYRRIVQLAPLDEATCDQLAALYIGIGNSEDLAYMARTRLERDPNDRKAPLWLAETLVRLNKPREARQILEAFIEKLGALSDKHDGYVRACVGMSDIEASDSSPEAKAKALEWLNKAVSYAPQSVEALAYRARCYRQMSELPGLNRNSQLALARKDLDAADGLGTNDPKVRYFLGEEWMAHGALDRAAAELQAVDKLRQETLEEHFFDINDWKVARSLFALELASRRQATREAATLADETLAMLKEERHRVRVLPAAIPIYIAVGKVSEARRCLDEYLDIVRPQQGTGESATRLARLKALVARAEGKPYVVITLSPTSVKARLNLASTLYQTGNVERAEQTYRQLLSQDPTNILALNDLAWILQAHDHDYAAALELVNTGLRLARDEAHLLDTRGTILANMPDRLAEARNDFQRLAELSPSDTRQQAKALLQLGRICARLNDLVQARQHLQRALDIDRKINVFTADERSEIAGIIQL